MITFLDGTADGRINPETGWQRVAAGDVLESGSIVRTYTDSFLDIRLRTGSIVRVMDETLFSLADLGTERIEMDIRQGEIVSRLERLAGTQEFSIGSPATIAGVRGTELALVVVGDDTTVFGLSGAVEVSNPEFPGVATLLGAGQKAAVTVGAPPAEAEPMSEGEINRYEQILSALNEQQVLIVTDRITFQPDSAELTSGAMDALQEISAELRRVDRHIEIVGHTADVGTERSQLTLSAQRAESVREYLVELGIPVQQLSATGVGGSRPITVGTDPDALRRNRRVEFRVSDE